MGLSSYGKPEFFEIIKEKIFKKDALFSLNTRYFNHTNKDFKSAPIRLTIFSDFQCPFCKIVSEQMPKLIRRFKDQIAIQYIFYPLDSSCNSAVKHRMHDKACQAAMVASCKPELFHQVHDEIFSVQDQLATGALEKIAAKYGLTDCLKSEEAKNKVITSINQASQYEIQSTPTLILNGKKIEGSIVDSQFEAIFQSIIADKK
jgi:predicted DsbA family dithiol-disulfide isomerase